MVRNIPIMMLYITFFSRKAGVHNDTNILRDGGQHRLNEERMTTQQGEYGIVWYFLIPSARVLIYLHDQLRDEHASQL